MGKTITIEISDDLYGSIQMISNKKHNNDLNKIINYILETFIIEEKKRMNDPIFSPIVGQGSGMANISEEHDKYIYGI